VLSHYDVVVSPTTGASITHQLLLIKGVRAQNNWLDGTSFRFQDTQHVIYSFRRPV